MKEKGLEIISLNKKFGHAIEGIGIRINNYYIAYKKMPDGKYRRTAEIY